MRWTFVCFCLALFLSTNLYGSEGIQWGKDLKQAIEKAKKEKKLVLAFFHSPICGTCKRLKTDTLKNKEIISLINEQFIPVKINADEKPALARKWEVPPVPQIVFIKMDGEEFTRLRGYHPVSRMRGFLKLYAKTYPLLIEASERLAKDVNDPRGNYCAGVVFWAQQRFWDSRNYLTDALKGARQKGMKKLEAQCHYALLRTYYSLGKKFGNQVIEHGEALFRLKPEQYHLEELDNAYILLAVGYFWKRNYKKAAEILEKMIQKFSDSPFLPKAYHYLGLCSVGLKQKEKAIQIWQEGIKKFPESGWSSRSRVYILRLTKKEDEE